MKYARQGFRQHRRARPKAGNENVQILEHLSKTAMRKVSTGAMLVKVIANVAVVYCSP